MKTEKRGRASRGWGPVGPPVSPRTGAAATGVEGRRQTK